MGDGVSMGATLGREGANVGVPDDGEDGAVVTLGAAVETVGVVVGKAEVGASVGFVGDNEAVGA